MLKVDAKAVLLDEDHSGRDEMNLAGNPFALLQAASKAGQSYILREWPRTLANGKVVTARWEVNGHTELGLPGPKEELLYLVLLQLSREQKDQTGDWPQVVHFSRHNLMERLGWGGNVRDYQTLSNCFRRLQAVTIESQWSFFDARIGGPVEAIGFSLIESYLLHEEKTRRKANDTELPFSWMRWNSIVHASLCAGNVRSLALDFTLSLDSPISRRLFRLLELLRHARKPALKEVRLEIFDLRDRLGMTSYAHASKIKQVIAPAIEELITRGYLAIVEYEKEAKIEKAIFRFANASPLSLPVQTIEAPRTPPKRREQPVLEAETIIESDIRADALKCYEVFQSLPVAEQNELLATARESISPIWHDRVGQPESPMSLGLWQLVAERYPDRIK